MEANCGTCGAATPITDIDINGDCPTCQAFWALAAEQPLIPTLRQAALNLYMAGRWQIEGMEDQLQANLWEDLRDALGLPEGHSTEAGVNG